MSQRETDKRLYQQTVDRTESDKRLLKLAWLLENLDTEFPQKRVRFNLKSWVRKFVPTGKDAPECGSVACACGWAAHHPWFNARGLSLRPYSNFYGKDTHEVTLVNPNGDVEAVDFDAAQDFFGISQSVVRKLFDTGSYRRDGIRNITRRVVSSKIRRFVGARAA